MSEPATLPNTQPLLPLRSPTYPQRVHIRERAQLQSLLADWEARIAQATQALASKDGQPNRATLERLHAQMLGARDQIADSVRRLPMEVGPLYAEDRHSLENAVAALGRLFERWEQALKS